MATTIIRVTTSARYNGLQVTVLGELDAGLLAIAGYGTPQELAIVTIVVQQLGGRPMYRLAAGGSWTASLARVAAAAVRLREATDEAQRAPPRPAACPSDRERTSESGPTGAPETI